MRKELIIGFGIGIIMCFSCKNSKTLVKQEPKLTVQEELKLHPKEKKKVDLYYHIADSISARRFSMYKKANLFRGDETKKDSVEFYSNQGFDAFMAGIKLRSNFIKNNQGTLAGACVLLELLGKGLESELSEEEIINMYDKIKVRNSAIFSQLMQKINLIKSLQPGEMAPKIVLPDSTGKMISLSDFKGKYVLIDFWASWCGGCRQENPNLKKIYKDFKANDFEIFGVSIDKKKEKWIKALNEDQTPWKHVCTYDKNKKEISQKYNLIYIPQFYLLDKKGRIVQKGMRGERLYETVKKTVQKK